MVSLLRFGTQYQLQGIIPEFSLLGIVPFIGGDSCEDEA
jgi:hypothetical protein